MRGLECNTFIESLVNSLKFRVLNGSGSPKCDICEDHPMEAEFFCRECTQNMCHECCKKHNKMKGTANHTVLAPNSTIEELRIPWCGEHSLEVSCYCTKCKASICPQCLVNKHSGHPFNSLGNMVGTFLEDIRQDVLSTSERLEVANTASKAIDATFTQMKNTHAAVKEEITAVGKAVEAALQARIAQLLKEVDDKMGEQEEKALAEKEMTTSAVDRHTSFLEFTKELMNNGTATEIAGSHSMVCSSSFPFLFFFFFLVWLIAPRTQRFKPGPKSSPRLRFLCLRR